MYILPSCIIFTVTLVQTSPSYSKVCPHDNVAINCTTYNSDDLIWYNPAPGLPPVTYSLYSTNLPYILGVFNITDATKNGKMRSSVVTLYNIMIDDNTYYIECWSGYGNDRMIVNKTTIISGIANNATNTLMIFPDSPSPPINLSINYDPMNQTLSWLPPTDDSRNCIVHYTVYDNNNNITTTSSLNTSLTLSKGTVHNFTVTSTDTAGRVGRHSHELTIIWDGKIKVHVHVHVLCYIHVHVVPPLLEFADAVINLVDNILVVKWMASVMFYVL